MRRLPLLLLAISLAGPAAAQPTRYRPGILVPRVLGRSYLLSFLPVGAPALSTAGECAGTTPTGSRGETLTFTRASSASCTKTDGTLVTLTTDQPRVNASGLLVEAAATNIALRSDAIDNAAWTKETSASSANTTTSPDGTADAETLTASAGAGQHRFYQNLAPASAQYTHSLYAKAGTVGWIRLYAGTASVMQAAFNLTTGVVGLTAGGATSTITASANGFYRVTMTYTDTPSFFIVNFGSSEANTASSGYSAAGTETVIVYGAQAETGSVASSYIATAGTSVTRAQEKALLPLPAGLTDAAGCLGATVYTLQDPAGSKRVLDLKVPNPMALFTTTQTVGDDATTNVFVNTTNMLGRFVPLSIGWSGSTMTATADAVSSSAAYDGTMITGSTSLSIGSEELGTSYVNGYIRRVLIGSSSGGCR